MSGTNASSGDQNTAPSRRRPVRPRANVGQLIRIATDSVVSTFRSLPPATQQELLLVLTAIAGNTENTRSPRTSSSVPAPSIALAPTGENRSTAPESGREPRIRGWDRQEVSFLASAVWLKNHTKRERASIEGRSHNRVLSSALSAVARATKQNVSDGDIRQNLEAATESGNPDQSVANLMALWVIADPGEPGRESTRTASSLSEGIPSDNEDCEDGGSSEDGMSDETLIASQLSPPEVIRLTAERRISSSGSGPDKSYNFYLGLRLDNAQRATVGCEVGRLVPLRAVGASMVSFLTTTGDPIRRSKQGTRTLYAGVRRNYSSYLKYLRYRGDGRLIAVGVPERYVSNDLRRLVVDQPDQATGGGQIAANPGASN